MDQVIFFFYLTFSKRAWLIPGVFIKMDLWFVHLPPLREKYPNTELFLENKDQK